MVGRLDVPSGDMIMRSSREIKAQIAILESLYERGAKDVHQVLTTPKRLYDDVINPTIKELKEELKKFIE